MKRLTLRAQLTIVYAAALLVGLVFFAVLSLVILDQTSRTLLDQRLLSDANAVAAVTNVKHGYVKVDSDDLAQFTQIIGVAAEGAIMNRDGTPIATSLTPLPAAIRGFAVAGTDKVRMGTVPYRGASLRIAVVSIGIGDKVSGYIAIWRSLDDIQGLDRRAGLLWAIAIPVIFAFAVFFGGMVAARGLRPLRALSELASEIEATDLSRRIHVDGSDGELAELCATIDRMLDRLEAAFARERRFTSDASHELRTPLTVLRAEAELALRRERDPVEYRRALEAILTEASRLEELTSDLLAAARAEGSSDAFEQVDLTNIVRESCVSLEGIAGHRHVVLVRNENDSLFVVGSISDLRRAVMAVLENAIKYSADDGRVTVDVSRSNTEVRLRIADQGPGFSPEALEHAFERFWRDPRGRSGTGLGLSIAQRIVHAYGGEIALFNDRGAVVEISFTVS